MKKNLKKNIYIYVCVYVYRITESFYCIPNTTLWIKYTSINMWASLIAQLVKNLLAMEEIPVRSLGGEDPLEKG